MAGEQQLLIDRATARVRAFELIQDLQGGDRAAAAELERLAAGAEERGWERVALIGRFGRAVNSWVTRAPSLSADVNGLIDAADRAGDTCMRAIGLSLRAAFIRDRHGTASPAYDQDLAEAVIALDDTRAGALERITGHTACGIAFDFRCLWELGDEQYAAALALADEAHEVVAETLLAAVMFNRAEAHVTWAGRLRQIGDHEGLQARWAAWADVAGRATTFAMPPGWHDELASLGQLMAALGGVDRVEEVEAEIVRLQADGRGDSRAVGHLQLARAVAVAGRPGAGPAEKRDVCADALQAVDPDAFAQLYDLALFLAAEVEAGAGNPYGLRAVRRQITHRWADRVAQLNAMRSQIGAERLRRELERVSRQATRDDLTGLGNRRALAAFTSDLSRRGEDGLALIMLDVDRFKGVNDRFGHGVGDAVLAAIARTLEETVRSCDLAVRLGGDEFVVALAGVDLATARERCQGVMDQLDRHPWGDLAPGLEVTVSIGVAAGGRGDLETLKARADQGLYEAKRAGGHAVGPASEV